MSGLSRAGFNEFQIKYVLGKTIPLSDMTYLQTLQQEIETKYPKAYEYVNIKPARIVTVVDESLTQELRNKDRQIKELQDKLDGVDQKIESKIVIELRKYGLTTKIGKDGKPILDQQH